MWCWGNKFISSGILVFFHFRCSVPSSWGGFFKKSPQIIALKSVVYWAHEVVDSEIYVLYQFSYGVMLLLYIIKKVHTFQV